MRPVEEVLPVERREALRREVTDSPGWYSPWGHLAVTVGFGSAIIVGGLLLLEELRPWELAFAFGVLVAANAIEWWAHKHLLHQRRRGATVLYDQHTPKHHMIFITEDMAIRSPREFRTVLMPAYAIVLLFGSTLPISLGLWAVGEHNLGALYAIVSMAYVVSYELLHLAYHLPEQSFIGSRRSIRWLRRHHARHHDPRLMQRWNFNVTVPLWDWVRGTYWR